MTKTEITKKLKRMEWMYLWANLSPLFLIVFLFILGFIIGLIYFFLVTVTDAVLSYEALGSITSPLGSILSSISIFLFVSGTYFIFSFWVQRANKLILGEDIHTGWVSILAFVLLFIPFINLISLGLFIYNWFASYKSLSKINKRLDIKPPLEKFISVFGIPLFLVFIVVMASLITNRWISLIVFFILLRLSILRVMRKTRQAIEKADLDLVTTKEKLKPNNKNIDISKLNDFINSKDWQYAKNGKLFFIKFNQGSIAEVTAKEDTQETKFYNWRINNGYLFCDNPDFKDGGQIFGELIQFKNMTLSPKSSDKTLSSMDNK